MDINKRVLILMPTLFVGGSERQVRYIIEGLEQSYIPVTVLVESGSPNSDENKNYIHQHSTVQFIFLELHTQNMEEKNVFNKFRSIIRISKWIIGNVNKMNVVWVMFTNLTGLLLVPVCKMMGCKVLFNERNPGIKICNNVLKRKILQMCDKLVANSVSAAEYMSNRLYRKVECINNGIRVVDSQKSDVHYNAEKIILIPARITPIKNQMVVLKAVAILKGTLNFRVIFVGQVEDASYAEILNAYVIEHKLGNLIEFPGYVRNIQKYYDLADLIILPSYEEGTPNVILEAYLNKKLCLASNIIMNRSISTNTEILFGTDDAEGLAKKIVWIFGLEPEKQDLLIINNYQFVVSNYELERMQKKYIDIFTN